MMKPHRRRLPERRDNTTLRVQAGKMSMLVTVGFYDDGAPAEVFVSENKTGTEFDAVARDAAVLLSLYLQHGIPLDVLAHAITRNGDGSASSVIGVLVDLLAAEKVKPL